MTLDTLPGKKPRVKHPDLEYRVHQHNPRNDWNCPDPVDTRRWVPVARFTYFQEALDYVEYAVKSGASVRLTGPCGYCKISAPGVDAAMSALASADTEAGGA